MDENINNTPDLNNAEEIKDVVSQTIDNIFASDDAVAPAIDKGDESKHITHDALPNPFIEEKALSDKKIIIHNGKTNVGRLLVIILICLSLAFTALALGITMAKSNVFVPDDTYESGMETINGADPNIQDSPIVFEEYDGEGTMTPPQIYEYVKDTNVGILVSYNGELIGEGSGIIVGEDDEHQFTYIITAAHVISDQGIDVMVQFSDETESPATIIGLDEKTDIGVIRVSKTGLKAAVFGNSDNLVVGQSVYAIGNPGGTEFFGSFTSGIVSAIDRPVPTQAGAYDLPCIQHNAAINPGNSGGALVNEFGQVIGLNSAKISSTEYEGMGFAVPSNTIIEIYESILANGYVRGRPMIGINYLPVTEDEFYYNVAQRNNLPDGSIVIASIANSSDLNNCDVQIGDIIIGINGEDLDSTDTILELIEGATIGTEITLTICRIDDNGDVIKTFDVTITLVEDIGDNVVPQSQEQSDSLEDYIYGD